MTEPEITHIEGKKYRYVDKENKQDFKFEVYDSPLAESARESIVVETIKKKLELRPLHKIEIIEDENSQQ